MQPTDHLKQSFRIIAVLTTVLVVMIHYRSATALAGGAQGWAQEWIVNGLARVAVPMFAFTAGFFYFVSFTGTCENYLDKLQQRVRSVCLPYLLVSLFALTSWATLRMLTAVPIGLSQREIASRLLLHPMAEQLWFLRDLMILVLVTPLIGLLLKRLAAPFLTTLALLWFFEVQWAPMIAGWYALNIETLFFFALGAYAVGNPQPLERLVRVKHLPMWALVVSWAGLLGARVWIDPGFDLWYVHEYTLPSLVLQKFAILLGCCSMFAIGGTLSAGPLTLHRWNRWAGCSFLVYLIHEFPLREVVERLSAALVASEYRFWLAAPIAILCCFTIAVTADTMTPTLLAILTGGRTPQKVARQTAPETGACKR